MKIIIFIILLINSCNLIGQVAHLIGYENSSLFSTVDTITFGFDNNCTIGLDFECFEFDFSNIEPESFDMRIIHNNISNDSLSSINLNGDEILFPDYLELKRDVRNYIYTDEITKYFSIKLKSGVFLGGYELLLNEFQFSTKKWNIFWRIVNENESSEWSLLWNNESGQLLSSITIPPFTGIDSSFIDEIHFALISEPTNSISESNDEGQSYFTFNNNKVSFHDSGNLLLFNAIGKQLAVISANKNNSTYLDKYIAGVHILVFIDKDNTIVQQSKVVLK